MEHLIIINNPVFSGYCDNHKNIFRHDLKKLKIDGLFNPAKLTCHYVRVQPGTAYVLFAKKAEPWNKLQIESLQKALINYSL